MPTIVGHSIFALSLIHFRPINSQLLKTLLLSIVCASIPDLDVIGFNFGIRYGSIWGHRGFSHSILFSIIFGLIISYFFYPQNRTDKAEFFSIAYYFFLCTVSHGILDAMTDGGKGVGFLIPFINERYFFPYRPIEVSPLNLSVFSTMEGMRIIWSELKFIGVISILITFMGYIWRKYFHN